MLLEFMIIAIQIFGIINAYAGLGNKGDAGEKGDG
jgi:hypothetical protein